MLSGWLLPLGFVVFAGVLFAAPRLAAIPLAPAAEVVRSDLVVAARRTAMGDPPHVVVEDVTQNCNGCHQIFKSAHAGGQSVNYHQNVVLNHGMNNRCVNCHDTQDREQLTLRDGSTVPYAQTPQLCSQCHGTVFRDWQKGTHGKTLGSWVMGSPTQRRLGCNECHNPHSPRYDAYAPLPGPNTLRMGPQDSESHALTGKQSPLQRWLTRPKHGEHGEHGGPSGSESPEHTAAPGEPAQKTKPAEPITPGHDGAPK